MESLDVGEVRTRMVVACMYRMHVQVEYQQCPTPEGKLCVESALQTEAQFREALDVLILAQLQ